MRQHNCGTTLKMAAALAVLTAVAVLVSPIAAAATVLTLEPLDLGQGPMVARQLQGSLCASPNTCVAVPYPASLGVDSIPAGAAALNSAINATPGQIIVLGYSEGAQAANFWMNLYGSGLLGAAPSPANVSFVLIGNPARAHGGYSYLVNLPVGAATPAATPYQVVDVARQYDGWADFPTNPTNSLAVANALAGIVFIHSDYSQVNLNNPNNVRWTEGNITYVVVPTPIVPLLFPFQALAQTPLGQALGWNAAVNAVNGVLKPIIDSAYYRPVPVPSASSAAMADTAQTALASTESSLPAPGETPASANVADTARTPLHESLPAQAAQASTPTRSPALLSAPAQPDAATATIPAANCTEATAAQNDRTMAQSNPVTEPVDTVAAQHPNSVGLTSHRPSDQNSTSPNNPDTLQAPQPDTVATAEPDNSSTIVKPTQTSDGNKVSPPTTTGTTQSTSGSKPGDGDTATTSTTASPTSATSTTTGSQTSASTSSSSPNRSTP